MTIPPAPVDHPIVDVQTGMLTAVWVRWFKEIERLIRSIE